MPKASDVPFIAITVAIALAAVWAANHFGNNVLVKKVTAA